MFLNRKKSGYGWYTIVNRNKKGEQVAEEDVKFISFDFAKDTEPLPQELNGHNSYAGELIFRDTTGAERKVFPFIDEYYHEVVFKVLKKENEYQDPSPSYSPQTNVKMDLSDGKIYTNEITSDDLPFDYEEPMRWK